MHTQPMPEQGFDQLGLSSSILAALNHCGFTQPTPIQQKAIPVALTGQDMIGIAQTGTGKTMAFGLPIIQQLSQNNQRALILVPTRELALQVEESLRTISRHLNPAIRTISLIGGMPIFRQIKDLRMNPRIIVATPGRLSDHLQQRTLKLDMVSFLVLDEADRMFDMGFAPQIKQILSQIPKERQTLLFSATMSREVEALANAYLSNPKRVEVAVEARDAAQISQEICYVAAFEKAQILEKLLTEHAGSVLVFARTKHGATKLSKQLQINGYATAEIHSNRSLGQRRQALDGFKLGKFRILVATDIAARGIDVKDIGLVVNYDLPDAAEDYVHRIGRTGRAGKTGKAVSFATPDQSRDVRTIERLIKQTIPLSNHSSGVVTSSTSENNNRRFSGGRSNFNRSYSRPQSSGRSYSPAGGRRSR